MWKLPGAVRHLVRCQRCRPDVDERDGCGLCGGDHHEKFVTSLGEVRRYPISPFSWVRILHTPLAVLTGVVWASSVGGFLLSNRMARGLLLRLRSGFSGVHRRLRADGPQYFDEEAADNCAHTSRLVPTAPRWFAVNSPRNIGAKFMFCLLRNRRARR